MQMFDPADITDSSSTHSDDTNSGGGGGDGGSGGGNTNRGDRLSAHASARRRKNALNAKERNLRRLESNERERMRMHSLNDAFQVTMRLQVESSTVEIKIGVYCIHCLLKRLFFVSDLT